MAGYIGSKSSVTLVDGYTETEADAEFVTKTGDTMTGALEIQGDHGDILKVKSSGSGGSEFALRVDGNEISFKADADNDENDTVMTFDTDGSERMRIDTLGNVGIGTSSPSTYDSRSNNLVVGDSGDSGITIFSGATSNARLQFAPSGSTGLDNGLIDYDNNNDSMSFATGGSERMRIDSSGRVLVGKTASGMTSNGVELRTGVTNDYAFTATSLNQPVMLLNRQTDDGTIIRMRKANSDVGFIGNKTRLYMAGTDMGIYFGPTYIAPVNSLGNLRDNQYELGNASYRWEDAFITNGVTTGSDANDKQDIATLTATEMLVAARLSQTFRTYRWKDKVVEKGDNARTHTGTIAQEVQAAFTAEGLDAGDYAMFISNTWWEHDVEVPAVEAVEAVEAVTETTTDEDGNEVVTVITEAVEAVEAVDAYTRTDNYDTEAEAPEGATSKTRLGIRYPELLSFVAAYNEQRFASIEARLTALEA